MMLMLKHETPKHDVVPRHLDRLDRLFDEWPGLLRRPLMYWPDRGFEAMRIEEFTEEGTHVLRVELPGIDPDKDVELTVEGDVLHIDAERREEEKSEGRDYVRREWRYGSLHRDLELPRGTAGEDVKATYKNGVLEIRLPRASTSEPTATKVPISTS